MQTFKNQANMKLTLLVMLLLIKTKHYRLMHEEEEEGKVVEGKEGGVRGLREGGEGEGQRGQMEKVN